jgi:hypothetical protein
MLPAARRFHARRRSPLATHLPLLELSQQPESILSWRREALSASVR